MTTVDRFDGWSLDCAPENVDDAYARGPCPAGGPHTWTGDVDPRYDDPRSISYHAPSERVHCDECGARP
jgi:hypothetical protein